MNTGASSYSFVSILGFNLGLSHLNFGHVEHRLQIAGIPSGASAFTLNVQLFTLFLPELGQCNAPQARPRRAATAGTLVRAPRCLSNETPARTCHARGCRWGAPKKWRTRPLWRGQIRPPRSTMIGSANDGAQSHGKYIEQSMALCARHARVGHFAERVDQAQALALGHAKVLYRLFGGL